MSFFEILEQYRANLVCRAEGYSVSHPHLLQARTVRLPDQLKGKLDLARRGCGRRQQACGAARRPCVIKDIRIIGRNRDAEIGPIQDVENLCPELHVKGL